MTLGQTKLARAIFALVEISLVIVIIAFLATLALPAFLRARKRSLASPILKPLRVIDSCENAARELGEANRDLAGV